MKKVLKTISLFLVLLIIVVLSACEFDTTSNPLFNKVYHFTHVDSKPATCTEDGNVDYWVCQETGKYYSEENGITEITNIVVPKLGHDMEHHEAKAATCTEDGNVEYWYCKRDGKYYSDSLGSNEITNVVITKLGHDMTHVEAKAATCEEDGNVEYWHCNRDGKNYSDALGNNEITNVVISKLGHDMTHVEAKAATCTEDGNVEYWYCNRDGKYYSDALGNNEITNVVITKLGHDMTHVEAKAATYEEAGNIEYWHCERDGKNYLDASGSEEVTNVIIPQLGRTITHTEAKAPTCEEDGNVEYWYCQEENKYYSDALGKNEITDIIISKLGHNYKLVANWSADGNCEYYLVCENDSNHKIENINGNITNTLDTATCEEAGVITYTLSFAYNGVDYEDSYTVTTEAKGHPLTLVNGLNPTAYEAGYKKYYSCDCGKYFEDSDAKVEILDLASWKAEGGNGYLAPLGFSATYIFTDKSFGATLEGVADTYFEATKDAFGFEKTGDLRGVQFHPNNGQITISSLYKYNKIRKIVIVASTAGSGITKGEYKINILDKTFVQSIDKARQKNVELEYVLTEELTGGIELVVTPTGSSCYIKSIQIYCESIGDKIHKHNYTYDVVWKGYEAYLVATCNECTETEEGHIVETKLELDVEEQLPNCENDGLRTYTAKLPAGAQNNNYVLVKEEVLEKLGHNYDFDHAVWAWADDLSSATFTVTCSRCGDKTLNATVSHETTKKATEDENGIETYTAKVVFDGVEYKNEVTRPILYHTHEFEFVRFEWNEDKTKAYALLKCTYGKGTEDQCPKEEKHEVEFVLNEQLSVAPTCENAGKNVYDVSYQNNNGTLEIELEALGHIYGDLIAEVPATCEQTGVKEHYECERCHELFIKDENGSYVKVSQADLVIEKLPHGTKQDVKVEFLASDFKGQGKSSSGDVVSVTINGVKVSSNKGYGTDQFRVYANGILSIEGALIKDVEFTFSGSYNGELKEKYENIYGRILNYIVQSQARFTKITVTLADQYVLTHVEAKAATCEAEGNIEYWYCPTCGTKFKDALGETEISDVVIAKLPHNYDFDNIDWKWADDYSSVNVTISCLDCDHEAEFTLTSEVSANGQIVEVNGVFTATFTFDNNNYTNEIDTNHVHKYQFKEWVWADDNLTAIIKFECEDESCKDIYSETIDSTFEVTVEPKCETKGTKKFSVAFEYNGVEYKDSKEVELEALGHDYKIYDEVAPKAEEAGTKEHVKCERCGDIYLSYNQKETVAAAFELTGSNTLTDKTLIGEITSIVTAYKNNKISVYILPLGFDETKSIECYNMAGGKDLKEGDLIKVTGTIKLYKTIVEFDTGCTFEMLTKAELTDLTINPVGYEIIYKNEGNTEFDGTYSGDYPTKYFTDKETTLVSPTKEHYSFCGWFDNEECNGDALTVIPADIHNDVTLYAKWIVDKHTVTFVDEDGLTVLKEATQYGYGTLANDIVKPSDPTKTSTAEFSYEFSGWSPEVSNVTGDAVYTATYKAITRAYTVTISVNNADYGTVSASKFENVLYGTEITCIDVEYNEILVGTETITATPTSATAQYTYAFVNWTGIVDSVSGDVEFVANFSQTVNKYDVSFNLPSKGIKPMSTQNVEYGNYEFTVELARGYEFGSAFAVTINSEALVATTSTLTTMTYSIEVTGDVTVVISEVVILGVDVEIDEVSHVNNSGSSSALETEDYVFVLTPEDGYELPDNLKVEYCVNEDIDNTVELTANPSSKESKTYTIPEEKITGKINILITGSANVVQYTITYDAQEGVLGTNPETYTIETADITLVAPKRAGYTFAGWTGTDLNETSISVTIQQGSTGNRVYVATWTINQYSIEFDTEGGTTVDTITADYDSELTAPEAPTKDGYTFAGWDEEFPAKMPAGGLILIAQWTANTYTVTFSVADGETLVGDSTKEVTYASTYGELPTATKDGYRFDGWYLGDEKVISTDTVTITEDKTLVAKFNQLYSITITDNKSPLDDILGTTTANVSFAIKGEEVTLTFNPEDAGEGKLNVVTAISINGSEETVSIDDIVNNELTFHVDEPENESAVTVIVTWTKKIVKVTENQAVINFGSSTGSTKINGKNVTGNDSKNNEWTITTVIAEKSFTQNDSYSQVGASSKPATSITFTMSFESVQKVTAFSVKFGGFSGTTGTVTVKLDETTIASGSLSGTSDVTISMLENSNYIGKDFVITVTNIAKGVKVYFINYTYETTTYQTVTYPIVKFDSVNGDAVSSKQIEASKLSAPTVEPTKTGYTFAGWYTGTDSNHLSETSFDFANTVVTEDITLYAKWNIETYNITYTGVEGLNNTNPSTYNIESEDITLVDVSKAGYTFTGWTFEGQTEPTKDVTITHGSTGDKTYTANFIANTNTAYKVEHYQQNIDDDNYTLVVDDTENKEGTTDTDTAAEAKAYTGFTAQGVTQKNISGDGLTVVEIYYDRDTFVVTLNLVEADAVNAETGWKTENGVSTKTFRYGKELTLPTPTSSKNFVNWADEETDGNVITGTVTITSNLEVWARWSTARIVRFDGNTTDTVNGLPTNSEVENGNSYSIPDATPTRVGYRFIGWNTDKDATEFEYKYSENGKDSLTVNSDVTLYAIWTAKEYTVFKNETNGTLTVNSTGSFEIALAITAEPGSEVGQAYTNKTIKIYHTDSNSEDNLLSTLNDETSWTMTGEYYEQIVIVLSYDKSDAVYTITYKDQGDVAFSGTHGDNYPTAHTYNTETTLVSPTKDGATFVGWYLDSDCSGEPVTTIGATDQTADFTLYAKWESTAVATKTYQHIFDAKPNTGNDITLDNVKWNITASNLGSYNSNNYAGVQIGTSKKDGSLTLTLSQTDGEVFNTSKKIKEVRIWLNMGGTSCTAEIIIDGVAMKSDGTKVVKNSTAGSDYTKATKVTFTPETDDSGVVVISISSKNAGYVCAIEIDYYD